LLYVKKVAEYILFLAENTGLASSAICENARVELNEIKTFDIFIESISQINAQATEKCDN
jgi:hypothetical protein